ncbi:peptide-methionine (S)-S-oxide reductase MsrA [Echinicola jeungdonensis]|uniref:Peptide methionine sulfoxide reductase MsrA n=1 Tax=Echinicola jeungdonensis TaxID=709343 RepID=A0ABV5J5G5_9BACT|nr:peptide-methionine (S)-S-oxide reductase MsrA [Echinicola jeungdonensis]MDN3670883.1 peptide-methionine (S)-S-oxide reductase MsrA [Echinicola jeungdonensis]
MILFKHILLLLVSLTLVSACNGQGKNNQSTYQKPKLNYSQLDTATFAGGCFWCVEASFEQIKGVKEAVSGYAGGKESSPTYKQVSQGLTGHAETVEIYYDPQVINYGTLLDIFFTAHDPTQLNRQGPDVGKQYRSVIFYHDENQQKLAQDKIRKLNDSGRFPKKIVTQLVPYSKFWVAEDYHQDYEKHHPDNPYIISVSKPKIEKVAQKFSHLLKEE